MLVLTLSLSMYVVVVTNHLMYQIMITCNSLLLGEPERAPYRSVVDVG